MFGDQIGSHIQSIPLRTLEHPQMREGGDTVVGLNESCYVLRCMPGSFHEAYARRQLNSLGGTGCPLIVVIHRPVVMDPNVGKQSDIHGVVGMVVRQDDIGHILR